MGRHATTRQLLVLFAPPDLGRGYTLPITGTYAVTATLRLMGIMGDVGPSRVLNLAGAEGEIQEFGIGTVSTQAGYTADVFF
ncbi:MAG TPA: hypothetical protein EYP04_08570 [Anaerolineae bacterium]|nr:hypothetical protein [Anaerolineae bacterium]HIQ04315.1 hypothetical protein [Anaerolineae bacterium]